MYTGTWKTDRPTEQEINLDIDQMPVENEYMIEGHLKHVCKDELKFQRQKTQIPYWEYEKAPFLLNPQILPIGSKCIPHLILYEKAVLAQKTNNMA